MRTGERGKRSLLDESLFQLGDAMRRYHRHQVRGFSHLKAALGAGRPVLLVGNHSLDVTDPFLFRAAVYRETGRRLRFIGHEMLFFRLPGVRTLAARIGVIPSRDLGLARRTLRRDRLLMLYPGAGGEAALRSYRREPYRLKWYGRLGFVELALREHATLLFVAAIGIDEMYYQTDVALPRGLFDLLGGTYLHEYRGMRLQLGAAGLHIVPGLFPFPVRLTHVVSPPLSFDAGVDPENQRAVEETQIRLWAECQEHLDRAVEKRERDSDRLDRALRAGMHLLQEAGL
jgi:Acyltransferase